MNRILLLSLALVCSYCVKAQDTLPRFSVKDLGKDRIQISWTNPFETMVQLSVQRSFDSLKGFKTIFSPQSPDLKQNGFVDTKVPPATKMYYRIFYVLGGGAYFFTVSKKPATGIELSAPGVTQGVNNNNSAPGEPPKPAEQEQLTTIKLKDAIIAQLPPAAYSRFRDSIIYKTKDTLFAVTAFEVVIKPYVAKQMWKPSQYVFTTRDGFVNIKLPNANSKHYKIIFFEEDGTELFQVPRIKESSLILDKANFMHAGWFLFDLYENGELIERNKFFVAKDF